MTTNCEFRLPGDPWNPTKILSNSRTGTLTTDHAASSYGLPVVVGEDGTAYGPADIEDGELVSVERDDESLLLAAVAAGYKVPGL